jgi:ribosomal-protein-alanine N-acetyltransferase
MIAAPVICRLNEASSEELAFIDLQCNRPPWSARLFATEFSNACSRTYGARLEGRLVGFLLRHIVLDEAHIVNLGVSQDCRRNGIGRHMLASALEDMAEEGIRSVTLEVRRSNQPAIAMYASFGFGEAGVRQSYYSDNREDALLLRLDMRDYAARKSFRLVGNS